MSLFGGSLWAFVVVFGFVILGGAIAWAMMKNRVSSRQDRETEAATRRLYEEGTTDDEAKNH
jgi:hypothetical protein